MAPTKLPLSAVPTNPGSRLHVVKAVRRFFRTVRSESHHLLSRSSRHRPRLLVALIVFIFTLVLIFSHFSSIYTSYLYTDPPNETTFTHKVHAFIPRPRALSSLREHPCSWLYLEFGAKDGRHTHAFMNSGNVFLEEYLRGTQSALRAFCVYAFEPDNNMTNALHHMRHSNVRHATRLDVFPNVVPAATDGNEQVKFRDVETGDISADENTVTSIGLKPFLLDLTLPWSQSGREIVHMRTARGNGNLGAVILRFNVHSVSEAIWYLDLLEARSASGALCSRVDRLILNFEKILLDADHKMDASDNEPIRDWALIRTGPSHPMFNPEKTMTAIVTIARYINELPNCRTRVHIFDYAGKSLEPSILTDRNVHYSILAGKPTFDERVDAQASSWMTGVPNDRITIFTNVMRSPEGMKAAHDQNVQVIQPERPELEQHLTLMQSWSHLVRTRKTWDLVMRDDPTIKWLALVDDDTFVFPGGMREYLSSFDERTPIWGGSGEVVRIDNGDAGKFATHLRGVHMRNGGQYCYMKNETVPKKLQGSHLEYVASQTMNGRKVARKVSHMCHDTFCKLGCPAVPQGAAIFLSRAIVQALRPHIEDCERDTSKLCKNCGSQRLYMCANWYVNETRTVLTRGICRSPWRLEHREKFPFALTFHGFNRYRGLARATKSLKGDMVQLWRLGKAVEVAVTNGLRSSYLVPMPRIADMIGCNDKGRFSKGWCHGKNGSVFESTDAQMRLKLKKQH